MHYNRHVCVRYCIITAPGYFDPGMLGGVYEARLQKMSNGEYLLVEYMKDGTTWEEPMGDDLHTAVVAIAWAVCRDIEINQWNEHGSVALVHVQAYDIPDPLGGCTVCPACLPYCQPSVPPIPLYSWDDVGGYCEDCGNYFDHRGEPTNV